MRVGIIVIGNEVLSGKVEDINSTWLMAQFRELGAKVARVAIVPDEIPVIAEELRRFADLFDVVITTGGVGPTHDDLTFAAVAQAFGREMEHNTVLEKVIRGYIRDEIGPGYLRMAMLPVGTDLIFAGELPFPITRVENVYVMPGEPSVLRKKFSAIRESFREAPFHLRRLYTRLDEGHLADMLDQLQRDHAAVEIGSYPVYGNPDYQTQITIESKERAATEAAFAALVELVPADTVWRRDA
ncbi:MAG: competence/damage-inducible protein A [Planctomycetes bacterium]|nr:competence/damage-inducible protein A [Planctomycetota bacterium]